MQIPHLIDVNPVVVATGGVLRHLPDHARSTGIHNELGEFRIPLFLLGTILDLWLVQDIAPNHPRSALNVVGGAIKEDVLISPVRGDAGPVGLVYLRGYWNCPWVIRP